MLCGCAAQTKEEIAHSVKEELTKSMSSFGFMIIQTLVTDIEPDMKVRAAMNEINAAQRMRSVPRPDFSPYGSVLGVFLLKRLASKCLVASPGRWSLFWN